MSLETVKKLGSAEAFARSVTETTDDRLIVVDVYTGWAGPCSAMVPTFKTLSMNVDMFDDRCVLYSVERGVVPEFSDKYKGTSQPRFLFYKNNEFLHEVEGVKAPEILTFLEGNLKIIENEDD